MDIIIVGCGKVGYTIARHLCAEEDNNITVIDKKQDSCDKIMESIDVMSVRGNALSAKTLSEAGVKSADLVICVTSSDETNILCCLTAKKLGAKHTIARVRDPEYALELHRFKKDMGLDLIINPEQQAAFEISRLLRFPSADDIETFENGRVELISFRIAQGDFLEGKQLCALFGKNRIPVLIAAVEREGGAFIANGDTVLRKNDIVKVLGRPASLSDFFRFIGSPHFKVKNAVIIGGGKITVYIASFLERHNIKMKIIEIMEDRCRSLSETLSGCIIIHGDGTDEELLQSENIGQADAVLCLTDFDEQNVVVAMYALRTGAPKTIIKINHINVALVRSLDIGSVVCPKDITASQIIRYVRGLKNSLAIGSVLAIHKIITSEGADIHALEFNVNAPSKCLDAPLMELALKPGTLIGCIARGGNIIIPSGESVIRDGDSVVVITSQEGVNKFDDILRK